MEWYLKVWRNYANFQGRARRKEYWMFVLIHMIVLIILYSILFKTLETDTSIVPVSIVGSGLLIVYSLAAFIPTLAVAVRRLHDVGKSGWMLFIYLLPFVGPIWLLVLLATEGQPGHNQYGVNPKQPYQSDDASDHLVEV